MIPDGKNINPRFESLPEDDAIFEIPEEFVEELKEELHDKERAIPHARILMELLTQVRQVSFSEWANEKGDINRLSYQVGVVEEIDRLAKENQWGLCWVDCEIFVYNGEYWERVEDKGFAIFLGRAAELMGAPRLVSRSYQFRENLFKQFGSKGYLQRPKSNDCKVLINLQNGTIEVQPDGKPILREFRYEDFLTYQLPFRYDPAATAPIFLDIYLRKVLPDSSSQLVLAEFIGYTLLRNTDKNIKLEKALVLYGTGANGKSVFTEIITALLGSENVTAYPISNLTDETGYFRAKIVHKLLNYASESGAKLGSSEKLKAIISGEWQMIRLPYKEPYQTRDLAKLAFNTNTLPKDVEHTDAFFRRFLIVPFNVTIPEEEQNRRLHHEIIESELAGVFNWVLEGLDRLLRNAGFTQCNAAEDLLAKFRKESNSVAMFIEEEGFLKGKGHTEYTLLNTLYQEYKSYCMESGTGMLKRSRFRKRLEEMGYTINRQNDGQRVYLYKSGI